MASVGDVVSSRYHLLTRLGAGALGEVWAARDETTDREVAVKLLSPGNGNGGGESRPSKWTIARKSLDSFFREAKASAKIRNPSVVELLDLGESKVAPPGEGWKAHEKKTPFVVMELLEGEKLEDLLEEQHTLPVGTALRLASEVAWALVAAHEKGLIHERIEPANVILHRGGNGEIVPKLVDFGIARLVDDLDILPGTPHEALSPLAYLSPEQIHGDVELDGRSDVYSLGALLHRCLIGFVPFEADDSEALLTLVEAGPKKLEEHEPPIDAKVVQLVADCLHRNRKLRPTMRVLAERLDVLRERFDAQWKLLTQKIRVPPERTIERISSMRPPPRVATKAIAPPRPNTREEEDVERLSSSSLEEVRDSAERTSDRITAKVDDRPSSRETLKAEDIEDAPVSSARTLSDEDVEDAPVSSAKAPITSVPPPIPKGPVSNIIKEKLGQGSASGLDVLADLESELLKHVASQRASETPDEPKDSSPESAEVVSLPRVEEEIDDVEAESVESVPLPPVAHAMSTAKTIPPKRATERSEQAKKSGAMVMLVLAVGIAVLAFVVLRGDPPPSPPAAGSGSTAPVATTAASSPKTEPTPVPMPVSAPPSVIELPPFADLSASASASVSAAPPVVPTQIPAPPTVVVPIPATTAAPIKTAPPPATTTAKPTAAPPATTAAPAATTAKPKPPVAGKPTGDPYFGVESAGF